MSALTAKPADLIIRPAHLMMVLNCESRSIATKILTGQIPQPDGRGQCGLKLWKIDTIRSWRPDIADAIEQILAIPAFAPKAPRNSQTPILKDAA